MKAEWNLKPLGSILSILNGYAFDSKAFSFETGKPLIRIRDLKNGLRTQTNFEGPYDKRYIVSAGDFLIGMDGEFECFEWHGLDALLNQRVCKLHSFAADIDPKFLFYGINKHLKEIEDNTTFTTVKHLSSKQIAAIEFGFPPLYEQRRIVAVLDKAFAGIATATANAQKNLTNARALFETYVERVFTEKGQGWLTKKLSNVCAKITDGTHQTPKYFDSGFVFLSSRNVKRRVIDWDNIKYVDAIQHMAMQKRLIPRIGDILLAKNGTTGVAAMVDRDTVFDIYVSLALLRPLKGLSPELLLHFVNSPVAKLQFDKRLKGTGVPNLHLEEIREVEISFPESIDAQLALTQELDSLLSLSDKLTDKFTQKLAQLTELKQSLLQKAFAGELT